MKIYRNADNRYVIERDGGEVVTLSWQESSLLYDQIRNSVVWDEVDIRIDEEGYGAHRAEIEAAKDDIIEELRDNVDEISEDAVYNAISRFVDLGEEFA
ncbi:hypothetical protein SDC9_133540 [bioreactor metagenome]|uniref:Uncharacterized protein n=1 Tax=bioreactor metagenome TaxID=1076179 RepID=A0A645DAX9_9ZZZZ